MLRLAQKAFWQRRGCPSRSCTSTPSTTFPKVLAYRDRRGGRARRPTGGGFGPGIDRCGPGGRGAGSPSLSGTGSRRGRCSTPFSSTSSTPSSAGHAADEERGPGQGAGLFRFATSSNQWDPEEPASGPLWGLYNGRHHPSEHIRVFPISRTGPSSTSWQYIEEEQVEIPSDLAPPIAAPVFLRDGMLLAIGPHTSPGPGRRPFDATVRYRTVGDMTCTGAVESTAETSEPDHRGDRRVPPHRAGGHPGADDRISESIHGRPKARGVFNRGASSSSPPPAPSTTGTSTLIGRLLYDSRSHLRGPAGGGRSGSAVNGVRTSPIWPS